MQGFDLLLNRIKEKPTNSTLRLRYLALVADLSTVEEKIAAVMKLAEFYRRGFPKEALEMAYLVSRYNNAHIPAIEIIIEVLQIQGKETQAKYMAEYLSKIRRNLQVNHPDALKQIKYAAGDQTSDEKKQPDYVRRASISSFLRELGEQSKISPAASKKIDETQKNGNVSSDEPTSSVTIDFPENFSFNMLPSRHAGSAGSGASTSSSSTSSLSFSEGDQSTVVSQFDDSKTEIINPDLPKKNLIDHPSNPNSISLDLDGYDGMVSDRQFEGIGSETVLTDNSLEQSDEKTYVMSSQLRLDFMAESNLGEKTEISSAEGSQVIHQLSLDDLDNASTNSSSIGRSEPFDLGQDFNLPSESGSSTLILNDSDSTPGGSEATIIGAVEETIVSSDIFAKTQGFMSERHRDASGVSIKKGSEAQKPSLTHESADNQSAEQNEKKRDDLGHPTMIQPFPLEINPFDGKLPAKFQANPNLTRENKEAPKLSIGKNPTRNQVEDETTRVSVANPSSIDKAHFVPSRKDLPGNLDGAKNAQNQPFAAEGKANFDTQGITTATSSSHPDTANAENSKHDDLNDHDRAKMDFQQIGSGELVMNSPRGLMTPNKNPSDQGVSSTEQERAGLSENEKSKADPFAFSAGEIPQLSGNRIFDSLYRDADQQAMVLKLQPSSEFPEALLQSRTLESSRDLHGNSFKAEVLVSDQKNVSKYSIADDENESLTLWKKLDQLISSQLYREALELLRNTAERFSSTSWWKKGFEKVEGSGFLSTQGSSPVRTLQSHEVQTLAFKLLEATKSLIAPHEYIREFLSKKTCEADRDKIFDFFFYEPPPGMELLQIDIYMAMGASLEAAQLVRDRLAENFGDVAGLVRRARLIWHSLGWQPFVWRPEDGEKKLLEVLSQRPRQRPTADLL